MLKTFLSLLVSGMLLIGVAVRPALAAPPATPQAGTEQVKSKIARMGVGAKAKATVWLASGAKLKGYIAQAGDEDFVLRDRKTDAPTTIRYTEVTKVDSNKGHSLARNLAIGIAVGVGATIAAIFLIIASLD